MSETFVGIDLTSAFSARPRPVDIALLSDDRQVEFRQWHWPAAVEVTSRSKALVGSLLAALERESFEGLVLAIDGPTGLAKRGNGLRVAERMLGAPGKTPDVLPGTVGKQRPFAGYIASSLHLFTALLEHAPELRLAGLGGTLLGEANLFEVFPGAEWTVLAGEKLPKKSTKDGRLLRETLWRSVGLTWDGDRGLLTDDEHDALIGAYLAMCTRGGATAVELVGESAYWDEGLREGPILHAAEALV